MLHMPVDVIATFNVQGKIKPNYIRLEDENHLLHTYKIENIIFSKEEKYGGIPVILFCCNIVREDCAQLIHIKYYVKSHQWVLVKERF
ncbi:hypothetical protein [Herbinix luporum]|jgi:hypothetical protein|uniref:Uncharacterized protein n=1 Tax=Herbinix luporum TaxID=1679721 RepID=A0A0K8J937_9FIRM|nr:hypothetical protein [Herbinix luporum]MDI9489674.1 hypothetical protein [Bacillota bacterium]CUH93807.1 hypothetical protein SD1D_2295 [Herbinix luporum]HHT57581.1 hypothetical protein [Herbinix luporum]